MDFRLTDEQERLRQEVCEFLHRELGSAHTSPPAPMPPAYMPDREFERKLGARGLLAVSWPVEYGGRGRPLMDQFVVEEEVALHGGPASEALGRVIIGPMLLEWGSEEQKLRYLPALARGEITFCLGYTEPEAGSDLASLQCRAVREGDEYVVNGHKVFTSGAHMSDYCWLAVRTDPTARKQAGISILIVPMASPGVQVRPLGNLLDEVWFNEVRFENVRAPASGLVGGENQGWTIMTSALGIERTTIYRPFVHMRAFWSLVEYVRSQQAKGAPGNAAALSRLAQLRIEFEVGRLLLYRAVQTLSEGRDVRAQAAMVKLFNTEWAQRLYRTGMSILGPEGALLPGSDGARWDGAIAHAYLSAVQDTIGAGTSEVQREIIALRGLGLPRD